MPLMLRLIMQDLRENRPTVTNIPLSKLVPPVTTPNSLLDKGTSNPLTPLSLALHNVLGVRPALRG